MTWNPVPWFVNGGDHTPDVARLLAHSATGGAEGVIEPGDCKVVPLAVPGGAVDVLSGAVAVPNRAEGVKRQSYIGDNPDADRVTLNPTTSSGPRSDLIIARIEDPAFAGTPANQPPPYVRSRVIEGVPLGTKRVQELAGYANTSAATLAIVTRPANTDAITAGHITDLRQLVKPRTDRNVYTRMGAGGTLYLSSTTADGVGFPDAAGFDIDIPSWATYVKVIASVEGMIIREPSTAAFKVGIGATADANRIRGAEVGWDDGITGNPVRSGTLASLSAPVPVAARGTRKNLVLRGRKLSGGNLESTASTVIVYDIEFSEALT